LRQDAFIRFITLDGRRHAKEAKTIV
jgi:hypothetical protein